MLIVVVLTDTTMMDKMKLAKFVHTNAQTVPLTDVMSVLKTELTKPLDVHVMLKTDFMKTETHFAHLVLIDVQLAPTETNVTLVLMKTETQMTTVLVKKDSMMTVLPHVKNVTTNVKHALMMYHVILVMLKNTELELKISVLVTQDIMKNQAH